MIRRVLFSGGLGAGKINGPGGKIEPGYRDRTEAHLLDPTDWTWHRLG